MNLISLICDWFLEYSMNFSIFMKNFSDFRRIWSTLGLFFKNNWNSFFRFHMFQYNKCTYYFYTQSAKLHFVWISNICKSARLKNLDLKNLSKLSSNTIYSLQPNNDSWKRMNLWAGLAEHIGKNHGWNQVACYKSKISSAWRGDVHIILNHVFVIIMLYVL